MYILLGLQINITKSSYNHVLSHPAQANVAENLALAERVIIDGISWYVPHYTPSVKNQKLMLQLIESKAPTKLTNIER